MKQTPLLWVGPAPRPVHAAFKKYLPIDRNWETPILIRFRFCDAYCVRRGKTIRLEDGSFLPIEVVHRANAQSLVGPAHATQAELDYSDDARQFYAALIDRQSE